MTETRIRVLGHVSIEQTDESGNWVTACGPFPLSFAGMDDFCLTILGLSRGYDLSSIKTVEQLKQMLTTDLCNVGAA